MQAWAVDTPGPIGSHPLTQVTREIPQPGPRQVHIRVSVCGVCRTDLHLAETYTIAQGSPTELVLSPGLINEATPSALASDGQSFNDCAYAQSCATP